MLRKHFRAILSSVRVAVGDSAHVTNPSISNPSIDCAVLEDRVLLSASPLPISLDADAINPDGDANWDDIAADAAELSTLLAGSLDAFEDGFQDHLDASFNDRQSAPDQLQLVIIDASVNDAGTLIADLESQLDAGVSLRVEYLDAETDGIERITSLLDKHTDVDAVHIVSHGADGAIKLGNGWLHSGNLDGYAGSIASWADSLTTDADILIYGCDLAASDYGLTLVSALSELTGADVAASTDDTGSVDLGGDWDLEYATGVIDAAVIFGVDGPQGWSGLLATPVAVGDSYTIDEDTTLDSNDIWFDANWSFRRTLSFDNLSQTENLDEFPVLVTLDASRIDYAQTQDAGQDLRFVDGDGTVLAHEIEDWNESGTSYVWVKAPRIDANSDTDFIWMYYGNSAALNGEDPTNVWNSDYKAVWHLDETSGTHFDSTANNQNLNQAVGGVNQNASGRIDGADEFDGVNEYLARSGSDAPLQITGDLTLEAWIWLDSYPVDSTFDTDAAVVEFAGFGDGDSAENYLYALVVQSNGDVALGHESGTGTNHHQDMGVSLSLNEWHQLTAVRDAGALEWNLFLDGAPAGSTFSYSTNTNGGSSADLFIGWDHTYFDGIIDEVRVQDTVRSADWIAAQHASTADSFITYGYEQSVAGVLGNDIDSDGDPLTAIQVGPDPANAQSFTFNSDGTFTYTPNPDFFGIDSFQYRANDGGVDGNIVTVTINVNAVNDPPMATDDADAVGEGGTKNIDLAANDDDVDDGLDLTSINILSGPTNGSLLINVDGTVDYTHDGGETVSDSFTYEIYDNAGVVSNTATVTITVTPVNDAPTATDDADTVSEGGSKNIDLAANDNDVDDGLDLTSINILSGPVNGSLLINADGTVDYTHNGGETIGDSFTYEISDNSGVASNTATVTITVTPLNDPPLATDDADTVSEGGSKTIDLAANDSDADDGLDLTSINIVSGPVNGSLLINADGSVDYTHNGSETVGDSFTYEIYDNSGVASNTATVTITVTPVNDPPTATDDADTVSEGGTKTIDLAANDNDADDGLDLTSINIVSGPANGSLLINADGTVDYTHNGTETVGDSFTYEIYDNSGVASNTATVTITVTPVNDPPTATDDADTVNEGGAKNIDLAANDNDVDDGLDLTSINILSGPVNGSLLINADGTVDYTHNGGETIGDSFTYEISDNSGVASNTATVTITVTPLNDPPLATDDADTVSEGGSKTIDLAANDNDADDGLDLTSINIVSGPANGSLLINVDGTVDFTHNGSETVGDSFTYEIYDNSGVASNAATVTITVTPVNDPPTATDDSDTVSEGGTKNIDLAANDNDVDDGLDLTSINIVSGPANGSLLINADGTVDYTHNGGETVGDSFTYEILDNSGVASNTATVTITVTPLNDPPTATDDADTVSEGGTKTIDLTTNDNDVDDGLDLTSINIVSGPANGSLLINADGTVDYTHNGSETVGDSFTYEISDNSGVASNTATVTITVTPVNDPPAATDDADTVSEGGTKNIDLAANDNDVDDGLDLSSINILSGPANGLLLINADGTVDYTHDGSETVSDSFTYEIFDSSGVASNTAMVAITVTAANDPPVATNDADTVSEGGSKTIDLAANDSDADDGLDLASINILSGPANGSLLNNADGTVEYAHDGSETVGDSFTYEILDNSGVASNTASVVITVLSTNDPPIAVADIANVNEGGTVNIDLAINDSDSDDGLNLADVLIDGGPTNGTVSVNGDGTVDYAHDGSESTVDSFTYHIRDNSGVDSNMVMVSITVTPQNDTPVANDDSDTVNEGGVVNINLAANDTDADYGLDLATISIVSNPTNGTVTVNPDGTVDYTHDGSETLVDTFAYTIQDNAGTTGTATSTSNTAIVSITVTPQNDSPVIVSSPTATIVENTGFVLTVLSADADGDPALFSINGGDDAGLFSINVTTGDLSFITPPDFEVPADVGGDNVYVVDIEAIDGNGGTTTQLFTITVTPTNDNAPTFTTVADISADENQTIVGSVNATDGDLPAQTVTYSLVGGADVSLFSIDPTTGLLEFISAPDFEAPADADGDNIFDVLIEADDGDGLETTQLHRIGLQNVNEAVFTVMDVFTVKEDNVLTGSSVLTNDLDVDGDVLSANLVSGPSHGLIVWNTDGTFTYTPAQDFAGTDSFTYTATDGVFADIETVVIDVQPVNDAPAVTDESFDVPNNLVLEVDAPGLLANVQEIDGDAVTITLLSLPQHGTVTINPDGSFVFTPDATFAGTDSFQFAASDGTATSNVGTVQINIAEFVGPPAPEVDEPETTEPETTDDSDESEVVSNPILAELVTNSDEEEGGDGVAVFRRDRVERDSVATVVANSGDITVEDSSTNQRSLFYASIGSSRPSMDVRGEAELAMLGPLQDVVEYGGQTLSLYAAPFAEALDDLGEKLNGDFHFEMLALGGAIATTSSVSVGYVFWMIRGGYLLGSVLSQVPAWRIIDPLQILDVLDSDDDNESLETIIDNAGN